jgi:hypothetical protein
MYERILKQNNKDKKNIYILYNKIGPTEQSQHQPTTMFQETELNVQSISP